MIRDLPKFCILLSTFSMELKESDSKISDLFKKLLQRCMKTVSDAWQIILPGGFSFFHPRSFSEELAFFKMLFPKYPRNLALEWI